jgi:competence protein ComEC
VRAVSHQSSFNSSPLALLAASLSIGVLAGNFALPLVVCLATLALLSFLTTLAFALRRATHATCFVLLAFASAGATLSVVEQGAVHENRVRRFYTDGHIASGEPVELTGVVVRAPEWSPDGYRFRLRVEKLRFKQDEHAASGTVELFASVRNADGDEASAAARREYEALELRRGARVRVMVALVRAEKFRNPGGASFLAYLEQRGLDATGTIKSLLLIERLDDERVLLPLAWLDDWRAALVERVNRLFSKETAGILNASLLGNREGLSRITAERFREGGTFHVLVISGLHITFVGGLAWWLARRVTRRRAVQFAASVLLTWCYALAVGAEASVVRASLMFTILTLAPVLHRRAATVNALGGAALVLLIRRPVELFDPSFQLSFLAVLVIVTIAWPLLLKLKAVGEWRPSRETPYPPVCPRWWRLLGETLFWSERHWRREMTHANYSYKLFKTPLAARLERWRVQRLLRYVFAAMLVATCVQAGMLPLMILYFHRLSLAASVLNVFVGAGMALMSLCALLALAAAQFSLRLAAPFVWLIEQASWLTEHSVDPFTMTGAASVRVPEYHGAASSIYLLYYLLLAVLTVALARWQPLRLPNRHGDGERTAWRRVGLQLTALSLVAVLVVMLAHPLSAGRADGRLHVDFLDVGQGDAALVTMPDGTTWLIDGGGRPRYDTRARTDDDDEAERFERDTRSIGETVVSEYLWWRGLDAVDYVLATHADADHIDGLSDVVRNFRVRAALVARMPENDGEFKRLADATIARGVPVYAVGRGDVLRFGDVRARVLWPEAATDATAPSRNNDSIVLRLSLGERSFLLTGDIEEKVESSLLAAEDQLRADVVKVAHHGSLL